MTNGSPATESNAAVFIGLGSNIGDREANLCEALEKLQRLGIEILRKSSIYETEPVGFKDQQWFLNQVIEVQPGRTAVESGLTAETRADLLLSKMLQIEREMGRERTITNGPRVIDLDLLLVGDEVIERSNIVVPHPRMHRRRFVLEPLCEIAPGLVHPVLKKSCQEMLAELDDSSVVRLFQK